MPILKRKTQVAYKAETNEGTAETPGTGDCFLVFDPGYDPDIARYKRDPARNNLSQLESLPGERSGKMTFIAELVGSGTKGVAPAWGGLMKACGFAESISTGTSVTYTPASASVPSLTLSMYLDGILKKMWGCRGDVKLVLEKGKPGLLHFTFTGADFSLTDAAMLSGVSYSAVKPKVFLGAQFSIDSYAAIISKLEVQAGNVVALRDSVNAASGFLSAFISDRDPKAVFDPEAVTVDTKDFFGMWRGSTGAAMAATLGSTADTGNMFVINAPKAQVEDVKSADRKSIRVFNITAGLKGNTGDDELSIVIS